MARSKRQRRAVGKGSTTRVPSRQSPKRPSVRAMLSRLSTSAIRNELHRRIDRGGGYTLVELLIVMLVIACVIAVTLPGLCRALQASDDSRCIANLRTIVQSATAYQSSHNMEWPSSVDSVLVGDNDIPVWWNCPACRASERYEGVYTWLNWTSQELEQSLPDAAIIVADTRPWHPRTVNSVLPHRGWANFAWYDGHAGPTHP